MKVKAEFIEAYGGKCVCCSETRSEFLSVDHIDGSGNKERRELGASGGGLVFYMHLKRRGWPKDRYRLLCFNCNLSHGHFGYCPHEIEMVITA